MLLFFFHSSMSGMIERKEYKLADGQTELVFCTDSSGIQIKSIFNKTANVEYLKSAVPLFQIRLKDGKWLSSANFLLSLIQRKDNKLYLCGELDRHKIGFKVVVELQELGVAHLSLSFENKGEENLCLNILYPMLKGYLKTGVKRSMYGMIPEEVGGVIPLKGRFSTGHIQERWPDFLPSAMNSMEVCSIYDYDTGSGMFCADISSDLKKGLSPIQFNLTHKELKGLHQLNIAGGKKESLPTLALGTFSSGGWQTAVDYYVEKVSPTWKIPDIPIWFKEAGGIYSFSGGGAGGIYMKIPGHEELPKVISNFKDLPLLLRRAERMGTNVVYLWDYWEGFSPDDKRRAYLNKGDYIPKSKLGGEEDFKIGIKKLHDKGGKVIVYIEPFIIHKDSEFGKKFGDKLAVRHPNGELMEFYKDNYTMNPYSSIWREKLKDLFKRYIIEYDVDGIFLDSYSWRMNKTFTTKEEGRQRTALEYSKGVIDLVEDLHSYARKLKSDVIVMGETTSGPVWQHWDGGLSADFAWHVYDNKGRIVASPIRYGNPNVNFMSNGLNKAEMNQIYAAGHNLALCGSQMRYADYIKRLLDIRREYKDALMYGSVSYQPFCDDETVAAYRYHGEKNDLLLVVNTAEFSSFEGKIVLHEEDRNLKWKKIMGMQNFKAAGLDINLSINPGELLIFVATK